MSTIPVPTSPELLIGGFAAAELSCAKDGRSAWVMTPEILSVTKAMVKMSDAGRD
jgi:hypothetical protein